MRLTRKRAFELGCIAMRQLAMAQCGNLTESLQEGMMTDGGLTAADKRAMNHQVSAIDEVEKEICRETWADAAYYGSYILNDRERSEIKALFPEVSRKWARTQRPQPGPSPAPPTTERGPR